MRDKISAPDKPDISVAAGRRALPRSMSAELNARAPARRHQRRSDLPDSFAPAAGIDRLLVIDNACEHPSDVGFDNRHRSAKCESGDGICGVASDAGKGFKLVG